VSNQSRIFFQIGLIISNLKFVDAGSLHDGLVFRDFGLDLGLGLVLELDVGALLLVVDGRLDLALGLQSGDDVLVFPSNFVRETTQNAKLAMRLKSQNSKSRRDDVPLSLVVGSRNSLVGTVPLHGILTAGELVRKHAADRAVKDAARRSMMEGSSLGVDQAALAKVIHVLQLVTVEASGDVDPFASHDDDSLPLKERLGDDGSQSSQQVTPSVDHQRLRGKTHCSQLLEKKYFD